jgi:PPM family protein phosphatase
MRYHGRTDTGRERNNNEDAFFVQEYPPFYFFGVADGMGGHAAGEVASSLAFTASGTFIRDNLTGLKDMEPFVENFSTFLFNMISEANYRVYQASRERREHFGMGTTLTLAILWQDHYFVGHVGDSRAYLIHEGGIFRVTRDHSLVEEMVEIGQLDSDAVYNHPQRHVLTRALGSSPFVEVDFFHGDLRPGDRFLLCTDGLTAMVREEEILAASREAAGPRELAATLVELANRRGGPDNITVVVAENAVENKERAR